MFNPSLSLAKLSSGQKGTSRWLSPELFDGVEGRNYSKESDIWAFGITVYVSQEVQCTTAFECPSRTRP